MSSAPFINFNAGAMSSMVIPQSPAVDFNGAFDILMPYLQTIVADHKPMAAMRALGIEVPKFKTGGKDISSRLNYYNVRPTFTDVDTAFEQCIDPFLATPPPEALTKEFDTLLPRLQSTDPAPSRSIRASSTASPPPPDMDKMFPPRMNQPLTTPVYHPRGNTLFDDPNLVLHSRPQRAYGGYRGYFRTSEEAKAYRNHTRVEKSSFTRDVELVKAHREKHTQELYEAIVDSTCISDNPTSVGFRRITEGEVDGTKKPFFKPRELEAASHLILDRTIAFHEKGFQRDKRHYYDSRGKPAQMSILERLELIKRCLSMSKATCIDVLEGGIPLRKLVANPEKHFRSKVGNKTNNENKKKQIVAGQAQLNITGKRRRAVEKDEEVEDGGAVVAPRPIKALKRTVM